MNVSEDDLVDFQKKILHICSNYVGTKIFPNLLKELNKNYGGNYLFCPVGNNSTTRDKYSYLNQKDSIFYENSKYATICKCYSKIDTLLFFPKRNKINRVIQKNYDLKSFDSLFAHSLFTDGWVAQKLYRKFGIPYSVFIQNSDINVFFKILNIKRHGVKILLDAQKIVLCSPSMKLAVLQNCIPKKYVSDIEKKISVIPFGIENVFIDNIYPHNREISVDKPITVITVGTITSNKNQLTVINAIELLREKGFDMQYWLVGKVADKEYLDKLLNYPFVEYFGPKDYCELLDIYRNGDIFVLASQYETFGLVYAEAMTQALPLLYSRGQGFDGQFLDGEVGYAVKWNSALDIANKLEQIIANYQSLSHNARVDSQKFCWNNIAKDYYCAALGN